MTRPHDAGTGPGRSHRSGPARTADDQPAPLIVATGAGERRPGRWLRRAAILVALAIVLGVRTSVAEPIRVASDSMEPTLQSGDRVILDKVTSRSSHPAARDLVVVRDRGGNDLVVKRVVAVGDQTVAIEDGVLVVDGVPVIEPGIDPEAIDAEYYGPVHVPPDSVFVLGDNRRDSVDSRTYGPVPVADVVGRVVTRLWPLDAIGSVS